MPITSYAGYIMTLNISSHTPELDKIVVEIFVNKTIRDCFDVDIYFAYNNTKSLSVDSRKSDKLIFSVKREEF